MAVEITTADYVLTEYVFEQPVSVPDYWQYSDKDLARSCMLVAESRSGPRNAPTRAESMRLFLMWREAIQAQAKSQDKAQNGQGQGAVNLWSLRKRTIQILVRLSMQGFSFIPETNQ